MELSGNWNYPTQYHLGAGRITTLAQCATTLGMAAPLVVTDSGIVMLGFFQEIVTKLKENGLKVAVFSDIKPNPTGKNITDGVAAYSLGNHDGVIVIGGGSALDAGKAIALVCKQQHSLWDFVDEGDNWSRAQPDLIPPIIAVPTTAGTGSEVGRASVILDDKAQTKRIIFHPKMMPELVIADPELTVGLPANLTAATGIDALAHNLEAYCAPGYHPMAVGIAVEGMRLIKQWLPTAVADGQNTEARAHMLVASSMGATAFQRGLGAIHALAHPLGAVYDAHHGLLNAILMPYVLVANRPAIEENIADLTRSLGFANVGFDSFLDWVLTLRADLSIPHTLLEIGIDDRDADKIAAMAVMDPTAGTNPIPFAAEDYADIFRNSVSGVLKGLRS